MKKLLLTVFFVFFIPSLLFADEVDKGLPSDTPLRIQENARQVIQLGIETNAVIKMTRTMLANKFSEQQIIAGHELLMKAKKQNLSEEPIINKLYEGIAKNVGAENILQAMEKVRARYELANTYTQNMKTDEGQATIMAEEMAECMAAGMDKNSMNKIMEMLQQKTRNTSKNAAFELNEKTLKTARTMARSGVDSKDIIDVMNNAFQRNYNAREMEKLGNTFMTQAKGMSSASDLAKTYSTAIKNGATPDNIGSFSQVAPPPDGSFRPTATGTSGATAPPTSGVPTFPPAGAAVLPPSGAPTPPPAGATP